MLSEAENVDLRFRCLELFVNNSCKFDIDRGKVFMYAEDAYRFVTKTPTELLAETTGLKSQPLKKKP